MVAIYTSVSGFRCLSNTTHTNTKDEQPKIYAACLSAHHNNKAYGIWVNATQTVEKIEQQISSMLCRSPYLWNPHLNKRTTSPFYAIHAQDGFYNLDLDVNARIEDIQAQALFIVKHGELAAKLIAYYRGNLHAAKEVINQRYQGGYANQLEYATQLFNELYLKRALDRSPTPINIENFKTFIFNQYFFSINAQGKSHVFYEHLGDPEFKHSLEYFLKSSQERF